MRSLPFDAQRTVNLFPVLDQTGKEVSSLYGTPGLSLFATCGVGPCRGCFPASNGRAFVIANSGLYELSSNGTVTLRGTLATTSGIVSLDENGLQLAIDDGTTLYIFTYATNVFVTVTDSDLPSAMSVTFIDGYFAVNQISAGTFYISSLYDGTAWAALDFATAESSPDNLLRVLNAVGQLWLFGSKTTEIWTNTGASAFPFERISGAKMETGILAPFSAVAVDNSVVWVGQDNYGSGIVYRAQGFTPQRISDDAVEYSIQQAPTPSTLRAYTYQQEGHAFYVLTGGGMSTSWVYDFTTQFWHERAFLDSSGIFELHLGACGMYIFGQQLICDRRNGSVYTMSLNYYDDAGSPLARERTYTHLSDENKLIRYNILEIGFETGVGTQTGQGFDPLVSLSLSKDGARTFSDLFTQNVGKVGKYGARVRFRRLGIAPVMTFRLRITDPVRVAITGSYLT